MLILLYLYEWLGVFLNLKLQVNEPFTEAWWSLVICCPNKHRMYSNKSDTYTKHLWTNLFFSLMNSQPTEIQRHYQQKEIIQTWSLSHTHTHTHKSVWSSSLKHTTQNYNYRSKNYTKVPGSAKTQIWLFAPEPDQRHILDMIVIILKKPHCLHAEKNPNRYPYKEHKKLQSINVPAGLSCKAFSKTWSDIMKLKAQVQKATMTRKREDSIL